MGDSLYMLIYKFRNPHILIKGIVCGVLVEDIEDEIDEKITEIMIKLIDELGRRKKMDKILSE